MILRCYDQMEVIDFINKYNSKSSIHDLIPELFISNHDLKFTKIYLNSTTMITLTIAGEDDDNWVSNVEVVSDDFDMLDLKYALLDSGSNAFIFKCRIKGRYAALVKRFGGHHLGRYNGEDYDILFREELLNYA